MSSFEVFHPLASHADRDYAGLDQGRMSTDKRHDVALKEYRGGIVLDWGCGTGLLVQSILDKGLTPPLYYFAVDILGRFEDLSSRCKGIPFTFIQSSTDATLESFSRVVHKINPDALFIIGVQGYGDALFDNSVDGIVAILDAVKDCTGFVCMSCPCIVPQGSPIKVVDYLEVCKLASDTISVVPVNWEGPLVRELMIIRRTV